jgi:hypothetical protein
MHRLDKKSICYQIDLFQRRDRTDTYEVRRTDTYELLRTRDKVLAIKKGEDRVGQDSSIRMTAAVGREAVFTEKTREDDNNMVTGVGET